MKLLIRRLRWVVVAALPLIASRAQAQPSETEDATQPEAAAVPLAARTTDQNEIAELRAQMRQLMQRIDELEKKQQAAPAAKPTTVNATRSKSININGYTQLRFFHQGLGTGGVTPTESINNRRTRLALDFTLSPNVTGFLQSDFGGVRPEGSIALRDMYVDLLTKGLNIRLGQQKFPMMVETDDNDLVIWPLERALLTTRLLPDERDRGVILTLRDHRKDAPPVSLLLGAMNGTGINQNATLAGKDLFASLYYNTPRLEARAWGETGDFQTAAPNPIVRGPRQRIALSARANFGKQIVPDQKKYGYQFSLMGAWANARGDFPGRQGVTGAGLLTSGVLNYTPNRVTGWYLEPVMIVTNDPIPIRLIGRYEQFNTNRDASFAKIFQAFYGAGFDATKNVRFIVGYTQKVDQTLASWRQRAITLETQLAF